LRGGNIIAQEEAAMAKVPLTVDDLKTGKYIANGAHLGFLIYPPKRQVYGYRPNLNQAGDLTNCSIPKIWE
jgi:hypothetical protein